MIRHRQIVEVLCDDCGLEWFHRNGFNGGPAPFWDSQLDAHRALAPHGWRLVYTPDTDTGTKAALCPACHVRRACNDLGHAFTPAFECQCLGTLPGHGTGCPSWHECTRCGHFEDIT